MAPATQIKTYSFYSRGREERLIRQGEIKAPVGPLGTLQHLRDAVRYEFGPDGRLIVEEGQDILADGPRDPVTRQPTEQDALAWLRSHTQLNIRFWEEGAEPDRLLPTEEDFLEVVTEATITLNREVLLGLIAQERDSHGRPMLLKTAANALEQVDKMDAEIAAKAADEAAAKAGG